MIQRYTEIALQPAMCEAMNGGHTIIIEHQCRVISDHEPLGDTGDAAAITNPEVLSQYRLRSIRGYRLGDLRAEQSQMTHAESMVPDNVRADGHPGRHDDHDPLTTDQIETLHERGIWPRPPLGVEQSV